MNTMTTELDLTKPLNINRNLPEGPGYSPDGGACWIRAGKIYWADGDVTNVGNGFIRYMPMEEGEDYSAWTDEHRAKVKSESDAKREAYNREYEAEEKRVEALKESARLKLTDKEIEACGL